MTPTSDDLGLFERLIRIETKLDVANGNAVDHETRLRAIEQDHVPGAYQDHETRLRRVERSLWLIAGAAAAGGGVVGQLIAPLINK